MLHSGAASSTLGPSDYVTSHVDATSMPEPLLALCETLLCVEEAELSVQDGGCIATATFVATCFLAALCFFI